MNNMKKGQQYISQISQRFADFICKGVFNLHGYSVRETQTTTTPYSTFCILHSTLFYTFSAKERDSETGLSYFGSRYYSSDLSIWLSVDPMSDKYPSLSPYVYCADNPVRVVDPNGEDVWIPDGEGNVVAHFDDKLSKCKWPVSVDRLKFGKTIIRFEKNGVCTHAAVYYGTDKSGNIYIYTKNGKYTRPFVIPLNEFIERYGDLYGKVSGYYN